MADLRLQRFLIRCNESTRETRVRGQILEQERNVLLAPVPYRTNATKENRMHLLCDEKNIDRTKVELVIEGKRRKSFVGGMYTSVKLYVSVIISQQRTQQH